MDNLPEVGGSRAEAVGESLKTASEALFGCKVGRVYGEPPVEGLTKPENVKTVLTEVLKQSLELCRATRDAYGLPGSHLTTGELITGSNKPTQLDFDRAEGDLERSLAVLSGESTDRNVLLRTAGKLADGYQKELETRRNKELGLINRHPVLNALLGLYSEEEFDYNRSVTEYDKRKVHVNEVLQGIFDQSESWAKKETNSSGLEKSLNEQLFSQQVQVAGTTK